MKEPEKPWPPHKWEYEHEYNETPVIDIDMITNEDADEEEYLDNWKDQHDWKEGDHLPELRGLGYDNEMCTLAELLAKVPADVPPEDVVISVNRDRMIDYINFSVTARRPTDKKALKNAYQEAYKEYERKEAQYQIDLAAYQEWKAQDEIKKKQKEIRDLKEQYLKAKLNAKK